MGFGAKIILFDILLCETDIFFCSILYLFNNRSQKSLTKYIFFDVTKVWG